MSPADQPPRSEHRPPVHRKVIHATCAIHAGPPGFCDLELIWEGEDITLWPHATGACLLILNESQAWGPHSFIGKKLG